MSKRPLLSTISSEKQAQRNVNRREFGQHCQEIFNKIYPQLKDKYYDWFIAIEPNTEDYLIDPKLQSLIQKSQDYYGQKEMRVAIFRLNETGSCGRI